MLTKGNFTFENVEEMSAIWSDVKHLFFPQNEKEAELLIHTLIGWITSGSKEYNIEPQILKIIFLAHGMENSLLVKKFDFKTVETDFEYQNEVKAMSRKLTTWHNVHRVIEKTLYQ